MDELTDHIRKLREDFSRGALNEADADPDPSAQFRIWMAQAVEARVPEMQAMNLATVSSSGRPSSRIVYLREFGEHEFCFYTNYESRKVKEIQSNPHAALTFFWPQLERQVRIEGTITIMPSPQSDAYFNLRPFDSKLGAWASPQSSVIASRKELEGRVEEMRRRFTPETISRPAHWGGLILSADYYEFWQGRKSRLHDRLSYHREGGNWQMARIAP